MCSKHSLIFFFQGVYISGLFKLPTLKDIAEAVNALKTEQTDRAEYGFSRSEKPPNYGSASSVVVSIETPPEAIATEGIAL